MLTLSNSSQEVGNLLALKKKQEELRKLLPQPATFITYEQSNQKTEVVDSNGPMEILDKYAQPVDPNIIMTDAEIVAFVNQRRIDEDQRRLPHKESWDGNWDGYNGYSDFSKKAPWQSKQTLSRVFLLVEKVCSVFTTGLSKIKKWFFLDLSPDKETWADIIERQMNYWLGKVKFLKRFSMVMKSSMLSQLAILRLGWSYTERRVVKDGKFAYATEDCAEVEEVDPYFFWFGNQPDDKWSLERTSRVLALFRKAVLDGEYESIPELMQSKTPGGNALDPEEVEGSIRRGETPIPNTVPKLIIDHYWGNIYNTNGDLVYKNVTCQIANEKYLVMKPKENPFWHGGDPYVVGSIVSVPFSKYNKSLVGMARGSIDSLTELLNLFIDSFTFASLLGFEIDVDIMGDANQLKTGLIPGKLWRKHGQGQLIRQAVSAGATPEIFSLYAMVDRESQAVGLNQSMGLPRMRGKTSAFEAMMQQNETGSLFDSYISQFEADFLADFLRKFYLTILQYQTDYLSPKFIRSLPEAKALALLDPLRRYELLGEETYFEVKGLSYILSRAQEVDKLGLFTKIIAQNPAWAKWLKENVFLKKMIEAFNWNSDEVIYTQAEMEEREAQATRMQAVMEGGGMPGAPGLPSPGGGMPPQPGMPPQQGSGFSKTSRSGMSNSEMSKRNLMAALQNAPQARGGNMMNQIMQTVLSKVQNSQQ